MKYILVLGYGWSGSGAVVDLLKEYDRTYQIPIEFRLIKDPGGLMDLRYNIVDRWDPLNVDIAIKKFMWHNKYLNQTSKNFPTRFGLGYADALGQDFENASKTFLEGVCEKQYQGNWFYFYYGQPSSKLFLGKLKGKFLKKDDKQEMYYSNVSGDDFDLLAKKYIDDIFANHSNGKEYIVLDQAVPSQDPTQAEHYFNDYKTIIVDRDPRDIYCDLVNAHGLIGDELAKNDDVDFFYRWFLSLRNKTDYQKDPKKYLRISFEDLLFDYEKTKTKIEAFLGFRSAEHTNQMAFLKPEVSCKNVGIWKQYKNQEAMKRIAELLPSYLSKYSK